MTHRSVAPAIVVLAVVACASGEPGQTFGSRAELICDLGIEADEHSGSVVSNGGAMAPTVLNEQVVGFEAVEPGSISRAAVILFVHDRSLSGDDGCRPGFIKRVVGLPGDEIDLRDGVMSVNSADFGAEHPASNSQIGNQGRFFEFPVVVPAGKFFVIGDSPNRSNDSRHWGYVAGDDIVGLVISVDGDEIGP